MHYMGELSAGEQRLLALERVWSNVSGGDINGPAATPEYRRLVDELIDREQAAAYAPIITLVLHRKHDEREARRPTPRPTTQLWMSGAI